ncbi:Golgi apparatus membrane protein TVP38 [Agrocybe pediades]|nr:Golgi apparatus membrane protein TVP38 [Agrocybe pediades]
MTPKATTSLVTLAKKYAKLGFNRYRKLHVLGKLFIWLVILFYICMGITIIVLTPARISQFLYDKAKALASTRFGWLIICIAIVCVSFPPLIGHTTLMFLCGFAYGLKGFWIGAVGSISGSAFAFLALRFLFSARLRAWSTQNQKWQALESVVRTKGLSLIILIRISPFPPWVYSNSLFASIEAVKLWQFVVATLFIMPKIFLHAFIGSRMAALSDGDQRGHMDTRTKALNAGLVVGGIIITIFTSWTVYNLVQGHIRNMTEFTPQVDELAAEAIEDYDEEAPLLSPTRV